MAELADAQGSGPCGPLKAVEVRLLFRALASGQALLDGRPQQGITGQLSDGLGLASPQAAGLTF